MGIALGTAHAYTSSVRVYADAGADPNCVRATIKLFRTRTDWDVTPILAPEVIKGDWMTKAALIVFPGGADTPYMEKLRGLGNQKLKTFVVQGGAYLGICAGSYYGARAIFFKNGPEVIEGRRLGFFPGTATGPLVPYDPHSYRGARAFAMNLDPLGLPLTHVFYDGGPFFQSFVPGFEVLASYPEGLGPAIVARGRVVLSGVHFELDQDTLPVADPYIKALLPDLEKDTKNRDRLIKSILEQLFFK